MTWFSTVQTLIVTTTQGFSDHVKSTRVYCDRELLLKRLIYTMFIILSPFITHDSFCNAIRYYSNFSIVRLYIIVLDLNVLEAMVFEH